MKDMLHKNENDMCMGICLLVIPLQNSSYILLNYVMLCFVANYEIDEGYVT